MKAKDRITAYVGTNADGTSKLPMAIIGKPMNPRGFRLEKPPVPYFSQRNACSDSVTFNKWFYNLFIPFVRRKTSKPVALLMDNCGPHGTDIVDHTGQIHITVREICINTSPVIGINALLAPFCDANWASPLESASANANPKPFSSNKKTAEIRP